MSQMTDRSYKLSGRKPLSLKYVHSLQRKRHNTKYELHVYNDIKLKNNVLIRNEKNTELIIKHDAVQYISVYNTTLVHLPMNHTTTIQPLPQQHLNCRIISIVTRKLDFRKTNMHNFILKVLVIFVNLFIYG